MLEQIGRYRVVRPLGRGAMGLVYLAGDPVLNRQVAIKMVDLSSAEGADQEFLRERLLRDAKAAAVLSHPNIVNVYDVLEEGGHAYVVMEYISGESLAEYLAKQPHPPPSFTVGVLKQIAAALDYTHSRAIIHRDIKPGNVMIAPDGTAKLLDFGIARISDARTATPTGVVMGTVEYMAPEQIKGEAVDGRADQFSLAAVAYQMLCGSTLYGQHSLATLAYKLVNEKPAAIRTVNASLPKTVDAILEKSLSKNPKDRFVSCGEFARELAAAFTDFPPVAARRTGRARLVAAALGTGILVAAVGLAIHRYRAPVEVAPLPAVVAVVAPPHPQVEKPQPPAPKPAAKTLPKPPAKPAAKPSPAPEKIPPEENKPEESSDHPFLLIREQMKKGDYPGAVLSITQALATHPKSAQLYHWRGLALQNLQKNDDAIKDYSEAIRLKPGDALSYADRGICYNRMHREDLALADLNRALALRPDLPAALNGRGLYYLRHNEYQNAIRDCGAAIRLNPDLWQAYQNRGRAKQALGDAGGAAADLKKARELRNSPE